MNVISAVTIGKLIEAHVSKNDKKFESYAQFIIDAYRQQGDERGARIVEKYLAGEKINNKIVEADA